MTTDVICTYLPQQLFRKFHLHRHTMGAAPALLFGALCQLFLCASVYAAGEVSSVLGCKASELLTGAFCTLLNPGTRSDGITI